MSSSYFFWFSCWQLILRRLCAAVQQQINTTCFHLFSWSHPWRLSSSLWKPHYHLHSLLDNSARRWSTKAITRKTSSLPRLRFHHRVPKTTKDKRSCFSRRVTDRNNPCSGGGATRPRSCQPHQQAPVASSPGNHGNEARAKRKVRRGSKTIQTERREGREATGPSVCRGVWEALMGQSSRFSGTTHVPPPGCDSLKLLRLRAGLWQGDVAGMRILKRKLTHFFRVK